MTYDSNNNKKSGNRCYRCNVPIYFTSKDVETPTGRPTKDPLTGKVVPLDPATQDIHTCKPEDIEAFKQTDERKNKTERWLSTQRNDHGVAGSNTSHTSIISNSSSNHDATNNNNDNTMNLILEKILTSIEHLEKMQTDCKGEIAAIKNELKIGTNRSPLGEEQGAGDGS